MDETVTDLKRKILAIIYEDEPEDGLFDLEDWLASQLERISNLCRGVTPSSTLVYTVDTEDGYSKECSYAWMNFRRAWEVDNNHTADDRMRTCDVTSIHPGFKGNDDMEGHFEFQMTIAEMKTHFASLGIPNTEEL